MKRPSTAWALAIIIFLATVYAPGQQSRPALDDAVAELIAKLGSYDEKESQAAERQLGTFPAKAVIPALRAALKHEDWPARAAAARKLASFNDTASAPAIARLLKDPVWRVRQDAAEALRNLRAGKAVPALVAAADDPDPVVRLAIVQALANLNPAGSLKTLLAALSSKSPAVRRAASAGLGNVSSVPTEMIAPLLKALDGRNALTRQVAERLLGRSAPAGKKLPAKLTDTLLGMLGQDPPARRRIAAGLLAGAREKKAVKPLRALLDDPDASVRRAALAAIHKLGEHLTYEAYLALLKDPKADLAAEAARGLGRVKIDHRALGPLVGLLDHKDWRMRSLAVRQLRRIKDPGMLDILISRLRSEKHRFVAPEIARSIVGFDDPRTVEPLMEALGHKDYAVRRTAIHGISRFAPPHALPVLIKILKTDRPAAEAAAYALGNYPPRDAIGPLSDALRSPEQASAHYAAATMLGAIGDPAAVPALKQALGSTNPRVRYIAVEALGRIGGDEALKLIIEKTRCPERPVRHSAVYALHLALDKRGLPALYRTLDDEELIVVIASLYALQEMPDRRSVAPLIRTIRGRLARPAPTKSHAERWQGRLRAEAAKALGNLGDPRAGNVLLELLEDENSRAVAQAAEALGKIKDARAAGPLINVLKHPEQPVRDAAVTALIQVRAKEAFSSILTALPDTRPWRRRWDITEGMGAIVDPREEARLLAMLKSGLSRPATTSRSDPQARPRRKALAAAIALGRMRAAAAVGALTAGLTGEGDFACTCALALGEIGSRRAGPALISALKQGRGSLPAAAAEALGKLRDGRAVQPLLAEMNKPGAGKEFAAAAGDAVAKIDPAAAVKPLIALLALPGKEHEWARLGAAKGLHRLKCPQAVGALIAAARDPNHDVRNRAVKALGEIRDPRAIPVMAETLRRGYRNVRLYAVRTLAQIATKECVPALLLGARTTDYTIRKDALAALRKITGRKHPNWLRPRPQTRPAG